MGQRHSSCCGVTRRWAWRGDILHLEGEGGVRTITDDRPCGALGRREGSPAGMKGRPTSGGAGFIGL